MCFEKDIVLLHHPDFPNGIKVFIKVLHLLQKWLQKRGSVPYFTAGDWKRTTGLGKPSGGTWRNPRHLLITTGSSAAATGTAAASFGAGVLAAAQMCHGTILIDSPQSLLDEPGGLNRLHPGF